MRLFLTLNGDVWDASDGRYNLWAIQTIWQLYWLEEWFAGTLAFYWRKGMQIPYGQYT
jgi:hypothetical protein